MNVLDYRNLTSDVLQVVINTENRQLDFSNSKDVKERLIALIDTNSTKMIVDLSNIDFLDSSGISVLVSLYKKLLEKNEDLVLCSLNEQPRDVLQTTQLLQIFKIKDS